jgi:hypothetical protein
MPAWTGAPGPVAGLTAAAADEVAALGPRAVVGRLRADPATRDDWVVAALAQGWDAYRDDELVAALRRAAASPGPDPGAMRRLRVPVGVAALADDPLHPAAVAQEWVALLPVAAAVEVTRHAPAAGWDVLGSAAAAAWRASGSR